MDWSDGWQRKKYMPGSFIAGHVIESQRDLLCVEGDSGNNYSGRKNGAVIMTAPFSGLKQTYGSV